jgi:hypothetical protein
MCPSILPIPDLAATQVRLFSYGTLQQHEVQLANFGRLLSGTWDALPGYRAGITEITDPLVIELSGSSQHPIVVATGNPADRVDGTVFELTEDELRAADEYEVSDYVRVEVQLASGTFAWVYLDGR